MVFHCGIGNNTVNKKVRLLYKIWRREPKETEKPFERTNAVVNPEKLEAESKQQ